MTATVTGTDLIATWYRGLHNDQRSICPGCGEELRTQAVIYLAYILDECDCGDPDYTHLVEQLWHRRCLHTTPFDPPISWRGRDYAGHHATITAALQAQMPTEEAYAALQAIGEEHDHNPDTAHCKDGCPAYKPGRPCPSCGTRHKVKVYS